LGQLDATVWPFKKLSDAWPFMIGGVVPDDRDAPFVGIARLDLGEKLRRAAPV
jgi:hypothetical protein